MKKAILMALLSVNLFASVAITTLKFRNHTIQINSEKTGSLYTLFDQNGKLLAKQITAEDLQVKHPDLFELVRTAIASNTEVIDASMQRKESHINP